MATREVAADSSTLEAGTEALPHLALWQGSAVWALRKEGIALQVAPSTYPALRGLNAPLHSVENSIKLPSWTHLPTLTTSEGGREGFSNDLTSWTDGLPPQFGSPTKHNQVPSLGNNAEVQLPQARPDLLQRDLNLHYLLIGNVELTT